MVNDLFSFFDETTLVVGPVLDGHDFHEAPSYSEMRMSNNEKSKGHQDIPLRGRTCPWNTCAIWRLDKLGLVGFPLIGGMFHLIKLLIYI